MPKKDLTLEMPAALAEEKANTPAGPGKGTMNLVAYLVILGGLVGDLRILKKKGLGGRKMWK